MDGHFHTDSFARTKVGCQRLKYITAKKVATNRCKLAVIFFCCKLKKCCNELSQQVLIQQCAVIFFSAKSVLLQWTPSFAATFFSTKDVMFYNDILPNKREKIWLPHSDILPSKKEKNWLPQILWVKVTIVKSLQTFFFLFLFHNISLL